MYSQQHHLKHLLLPLLLIRILLSTSTQLPPVAVLVEPVKVAPLHYSTSPPHPQPLPRLYASSSLPN